MVRILGALLRALLVSAVIMYPTVVLTPGSNSTDIFTLAFAIIAGSIVFVEYSVEIPAIFEFRFARPYNRFRFLLLAAVVLLLVLQLEINYSGGGSTGFLASVQAFSKHIMSGWYSPAMLLVDAMAEAHDHDNMNCMETASFTFLFMIVSCSALGLWIWIGSWPLSKDGFNLWPNMPSFSLRAGQKAAGQMIKVAILSFTLAVTLPYLIPMFVKYGRVDLGIDYIHSPLAMFWVHFFWIAIPAMAILRTITLLKLALLAENLRKF